MAKIFLQYLRMEITVYGQGKIMVMEGNAITTFIPLCFQKNTLLHASVLALDVNHKVQNHLIWMDLLF